MGACCRRALLDGQALDKHDRQELSGILKRQLENKFSTLKDWVASQTEDQQGLKSERYYWANSAN